MTTVATAVEEFLLSQMADGNSTATVRWYRNILKPMISQFGACPLGEVTTHDLREHMTARRDQLAAASYSSYSTALHSFWAWCGREYHMSNPMGNIKRVRQPEPDPKAIAAADFIKLLDHVGDNDAGIRDRVMMVFLADTGVRVEGLVTLTFENLFINEGYALVKEKGAKRRRVPFTKYTARLLHLWKSIRKADNDYVWVSMTTGEPLTTWGVRQMLKRLKRRAGVTGRVNPHAFRHNFARAYLKAGGDHVTLARLMGHADVNTTAKAYAVFTPDELAEMHEERTPLRVLFGGDHASG